MGYLYKNKGKILLVDSQPDIIKTLAHSLEKEAYAVYTATDGKEAIDMALKEEPDLIILAIDTKKMDGIEVCKELRRLSQFDQTMIAFLTSRSESYSEVAGLEAGADDYIVKPVKIPVILARVKTLLRRFNRNFETKQSLVFKDLRIDLEEMTVSKKGSIIELPKKEFELLVLLASKPGKVFKRKEIYRKIWGSNDSTSDRVIDVYMGNLRKKIGKKFFKTKKGSGYKFIS